MDMGIEYNTCAECIQHIKYQRAICIYSWHAA